MNAWRHPSKTRERMDDRSKEKHHLLPSTIGDSPDNEDLLRVECATHRHRDSVEVSPVALTLLHAGHPAATGLVDLVHLVDLFSDLCVGTVRESYT
jgi:hypothetical protein